MPILDVFKKGKKKQETVEKKVVEKKKPSATPSVKGDLQRDTAFAYGVIYHQHVTEKATDLGTLNKYVFKVFRSANKDNVKKSIEKLYKVKVKSVNMINVPSKGVRFGRFEGTKGGYKKAIVTLMEGHKIEVSPH